MYPTRYVSARNAQLAIPAPPSLLANTATLHRPATPRKLYTSRKRRQPQTLVMNRSRVRFSQVAPVRARNQQEPGPSAYLALRIVRHAHYESSDILTVNGRREVRHARCSSAGTHSRKGRSRTHYGRNIALMARRSSMARYASATSLRGSSRSKTFPGLIFRFHTKSSSSGRY